MFSYFNINPFIKSLSIFKKYDVCNMQKYPLCFYPTVFSVVARYIWKVNKKSKAEKIAMKNVIYKWNFTGL